VKLNEAAQIYKENTGQTAPTNFDAAKRIIVGEVTNAITAGGGTQTERDAANADLNRANSLPQLMGTMQVYQSLLGGKLQGLAKQYGATTGRNDFYDRFINPETQQATKTGPQFNGQYDVNQIDSILRARGAIK
jgi:hypothetical protein